MTYGVCARARMWFPTGTVGIIYIIKGCLGDRAHGPSAR